KPGTPGALVATEWTTPDIWLRRTFPFDGKPLQRPQLCVHHDEDAEISINGVSVLKTTGYTVDYEFFPLTQPNLLRQGTNTIAIHCRQTRGGQYIDAGIVDLRQP
ncbi:MAG: beta-galactosidase, partial [Lentisphaeria bacterium]|nr:beta-galactosidase [Lentisphaeria bacterium]